MGIETEDKAFKGEANRVINFAGGKIVSDNDGVAIAKTYEEARLLIAYKFVPIEGEVSDFIIDDKETVKEETIEEARVDEVPLVKDKSEKSVLDKILDFFR